MNKCLEALENLRKEHYVDNRLPLIDRVRFDIIEKELKALEIIKKNITNIDENNHYGVFGIFVDISSLTQEEYETLKEVLI